MATIEAAIDACSNVLVKRFVDENAVTRVNVEELKKVMDAMGGDKFVAMATKMAQLDQTLLDRTSMLGDMFTKSSGELRDRMYVHDTSFAEVYGKLAAIGRFAQDAGSR